MSDFKLLIYLVHGRTQKVTEASKEQNRSESNSEEQRGAGTASWSNNKWGESYSPEPEDEIMFPDLWTSSNLLKITFNLWERTESEQNQTVWHMEQVWNKSDGKKSVWKLKPGEQRAPSLPSEVGRPPSALCSRVGPEQCCHIGDELATGPEREREGGESDGGMQRHTVWSSVSIW